MDKTDGLVDVNDLVAIVARSAHSVKRLMDKHLGPDEVCAVAAHLWTNHSKAVDLVSDHRLREILAAVPVV